MMTASDPTPPPSLPDSAASTGQEFPDFADQESAGPPGVLFASSMPQPAPFQPPPPFLPPEPMAPPAPFLPPSPLQVQIAPPSSAPSAPSPPVSPAKPAPASAAPASPSLAGSASAASSPAVSGPPTQASSDAVPPVHARPPEYYHDRSGGPSWIRQHAKWWVPSAGGLAVAVIVLLKVALAVMVPTAYHGSTHATHPSTSAHATHPSTKAHATHSSSSASPAGVSAPITVGPASPPSPAEQRWMKGLAALLHKMNNFVMETGTVTPSSLHQSAVVLQRCTPELAALGPPSPLLRPTYRQARRACIDFEQGAIASAAAARAYTIYPGPGLTRFSTLLTRLQNEVNAGINLMTDAYYGAPVTVP